jgi:insertion element IS1 protein InsB
MDKQTRQIIAFHVGDRSRDSAEQLGQNMPEVYREQATFYTDQYTAYLRVIPAAQHQATTNLARKTNHVERFNNTLRQRVSWAAARWRSPKKWTTTSVRYATSSVTTISQERQLFV